MIFSELFFLSMDIIFIDTYNHGQNILELAFILEYFKLFPNYTPLRTPSPQYNVVYCLRLSATLYWGRRGYVLRSNQHSSKYFVHDCSCQHVYIVDSHNRNHFGMIPAMLLKYINFRELANYIIDIYMTPSHLVQYEIQFIKTAQKKTSVISMHKCQSHLFALKEKQHKCYKRRQCISYENSEKQPKLSTEHTTPSRPIKKQNDKNSIKISDAKCIKAFRKRNSMLPVIYVIFVTGVYTGNLLFYFLQKKKQD